MEKLRLGKDLTFLNRRAMTFICTNALCDKVRLSGSGVQFTTKADPEKWLQVENPAASCIADMRKKIVCPLLSALKKDSGSVEAPVPDGDVATEGGVASAPTAEAIVVVD